MKLWRQAAVDPAVTLLTWATPLVRVLRAKVQAEERAIRRMQPPLRQVVAVALEVLATRPVAPRLLAQVALVWPVT